MLSTILIHHPNGITGITRRNLSTLPQVRANLERYLQRRSSLDTACIDLGMFGNGATGGKGTNGRAGAKAGSGVGSSGTSTVRHSSPDLASQQTYHPRACPFCTEGIRLYEQLRSMHQAGTMKGTSPHVELSKDKRKPMVHCACCLLKPTASKDRPRGQSTKC